MRVTVVGATGTMGRAVTERLRARGHDIVEAARATGVDALTGAGVAAAVEGADVLLDCLNTATVSRSKAVDFFTTTARTISAAALTARVGHVVLLSICNVTDPVVRRGLGYYAGKAAQEEAYAASRLPVTTVATTQWFSLAGQLLEQTRVGPVAFVPSMLLQPVHPDAVADLLVEAVEEGHAAVEGDAAADEDATEGARVEAAWRTDTGRNRQRRLQLAGPERIRADRMVRRLAESTGRGIRVLGVPYPGGRFRNGGLVPRGEVRVDPRRYADWLAAQKRFTRGPEGRRDAGRDGRRD